MVMRAQQSRAGQGQGVGKWGFGGLAGAHWEEEAGRLLYPEMVHLPMWGLGRVQVTFSAFGPQDSVMTVRTRLS